MNQKASIAITVEKTVDLINRGIDRIKKNSFLVDLETKHKLHLFQKIEKQVVQIENILRYEKEAPQIALIGQTKSGKSTILNVLLGNLLATTGSTEKQVVPVGYICGESIDKQYGIRKGGSRIEIDKSIFSEIEGGKFHQDYIAILRNAQINPFQYELVLWDTPGLFGGDIHQQNLEGYLDAFDVLLWIFDGEAVGNSVVNHAYREALKSGKKIIPVLNFVEKHEREEREEVLNTISSLLENKPEEWHVITPDDIDEKRESSVFKEIRKSIDSILENNEKAKWARNKLQYRLYVIRSIFNDFCNKTYMTLGALKGKIGIYKDILDKYEKALRRHFELYCAVLGTEQEKELIREVEKHKDLSDAKFEELFRNNINVLAREVDGYVKKVSREELETILYSTLEDLKIDSSIFAAVSNLKSLSNVEKTTVVTNEDIYKVTALAVGGGVLFDLVADHALETLVGDMVIPGVGGFIVGKAIKGIQEHIRSEKRVNHIQKAFAGIRLDFHNEIESHVIKSVNVFRPKVEDWINKEKERFELPKGMNDLDVEKCLEMIRKDTVDELYLPILEPVSTAKEDAVFLRPEPIDWNMILELLSKAKKKVFLRSSHLDAKGLENVINHIGNGVELDYRITFPKSGNTLEQDLNEKEGYGTKKNQIDEMLKLLEKFDPRTKPVFINIEKKARGNAGKFHTRLMVIDDTWLIRGENEFRNFESKNREPANKKYVYEVCGEYKDSDKEDLISYVEEYEHSEKFTMYIKRIENLDTVSIDSAQQQLGAKFRVSAAF